MSWWMRSQVLPALRGTASANRQAAPLGPSTTPGPGAPRTALLKFVAGTVPQGSPSITGLELAATRAEAAEDEAGRSGWPLRAAQPEEEPLHRSGHMCMEEIGGFICSPLDTGLLLKPTFQREAVDTGKSDCRFFLDKHRRSDCRFFAAAVKQKWERMFSCSTAPDSAHPGEDICC